MVNLSQLVEQTSKIMIALKQNSVFLTGFVKCYDIFSGI